jgi:hypothetical protein
MAEVETASVPATAKRTKPASPKAVPKLATPQKQSVPDVKPLEELACGILSRAIKPRAADIRRLAEAVLAKAAKKAKKADGKKKKKKKGSKKLAKIPRQPAES